MIHQADALRIDARPYAALRDLIHLLDALLAAFADAPQELCVGMIDGTLQNLPRRRAIKARSRRMSPGQRRGADAVHLDAEFLQGALEGRAPPRTRRWNPVNVVGLAKI